MFEEFEEVVVAIFDNAYEIIRDAVTVEPEAYTFNARQLLEGCMHMLTAIETQFDMEIEPLRDLFSQELHAVRQVIGQLQVAFGYRCWINISSLR